MNPDRQRTLRGDRRILLSQRAGGRVAGIRRRLLSLGDQTLVERVEPAEREVDLAADLEQRRRRLAVRDRFFALEPFARVDSTPRDRDRVHAGVLRRADVERRIADVRALVWLRPEPLSREQQGLRMRLVPLCLVAAD